MAETKLKVLMAFGTRPEAIKLAPVIDALRAEATIDCVVCVTAQHRGMLDQALALFDIRPDYDLDLMTPGQALTDFVASACHPLGEVLERERPDWVVVQGDTITSFVVALVSFLGRFKVAHVEAGLRTYDKAAPFPEEVSRSLISRIADLHFAPTMRARQQLIAERVPAAQIWVTGNAVVDALDGIADKVARETPAILRRLGVTPPHVLVTGHRRESFGLPLERICLALRQLALGHPRITFIYPVHPNPDVQRLVGELLAGFPNIRLLEPCDYVSFTALASSAEFIITDSGGVQEEAPSLGKFVLVTREVTERGEIIEAGLGRLVGSDVRRIVAEAERLLRGDRPDAAYVRRCNPFGDGLAARRIREVLVSGRCEELAHTEKVVGL